MSTPPAEDGKVQETIEQEQLRKLQLENEALERERSLAVDTPGGRSMNTGSSNRDSNL